MNNYGNVITLLSSIILELLPKPHTVKVQEQPVYSTPKARVVLVGETFDTEFK